MLRIETNEDMLKNIFLFIGPPTGGKSTQALFLSETIRIPVVRSRDIVPDLVVVYSGNRDLIPDDVFVPRLRNLLESTSHHSLIFDNLPRTMEQASFLLQWANTNEVGLQVINLNLTRDEVISRAQGRLVCPVC